MALQCSIGDVQIAVCTLRYGLLHRITVDLQFALCKLHVSVLHCSTDGFQFVLLKLYFVTFLCRSVTFFENEISTNFLSNFRRKIQPFPKVQWCGGNILEDSPMIKQGTKVRTTQFLRMH
jgi:hypothetical protein